MKTSKRTKALACITAALALIYIIQILAGLKSPQKEFKLKESPDYISCENSGEIIQMQKNGEDWFSSGTPLDSSKMESLLKDVTLIKTLSLASRKGDGGSLERYGLDKPILVRAKSGGKDQCALLIGKESATGSQCYIQFEGKKEIYLAQGNLRRDWTFTLDDIRQKSEEQDSDNSAAE